MKMKIFLALLIVSVAAWVAFLLSKPSIDSPNSWERHRALNETEIDQSTLERVAAHDPDWEIRKSAIAKLLNQELLYEIASGKEHSSIRRVAASRITDQALLLPLALENDDRYVRMAAAFGLDDLNIVARVVIEDDNQYVRDTVFCIFQFKSSEKQTQLAEIVIKSQVARIRRAAFEKLSTPSALIRVALESEKFKLRKAALAGIEVQSVIAKIAMDDAFQANRLMAIGKLTDQSLLEEIARNSRVPMDKNDQEIRLLALGELSDQSVLEEIAWTSKPERIQKSAAKRIEDQGAIEKIARGHLVAGVRGVAVRQLLNQDSLLQIAREDKDIWVRVHAIGKIERLGLIAGFAIADSQERVREAAVKRIATRSAVEDSLIISYSESVRHDIETIDLATGIIKSLTEGQKGKQKELLPYRRNALNLHLIDIIRVLRSPLLVSETGGIESIDAEWHRISQVYVPENRALQRQTMKGESFTVHFLVKKRTGRFQFRWKSKFPSTKKTTVFSQGASGYRLQVALPTVGARIQFAQVLEELFVTLSQETLTSIAKDDENSDVRAMAAIALARKARDE